jgi:glycosyltransferase involved in cell wall biosynthesis
MALANSDFVVVPSLTLERIALETWRFPAHRVRYIPDGIDVERFARKRPLTPDPENRERVVLGTVAPLRSEKNIGRLIEAFSLLASDPRFELIIVGDGPERMHLECATALRGLSGRVRFLGHHPRPEEALTSFDIFCLTSDTEQIPNAVLEAMAVALPVVSVDVGDITAMIAVSNLPYVIDPERIEAFASAVRELADNTPLRRRIGADNRMKIETHFGQERMFRKYEALLLG